MGLGQAQKLSAVKSTSCDGLRNFTLISFSPSISTIPLSSLLSSSHDQERMSLGSARIIESLHRNSRQATLGPLEEVTANQVTPSLQIEGDESQSFTLFHSFLYYLYETTSAYLFALITSPSSILFDPLSTFTALLIYPVLWTLLAGIVLVLWFGRMMGCGRLVEKVAGKWFGGFSIVNWVSIQLFRACFLSCWLVQLIFDVIRQTRKSSREVKQRSPMLEAS